MITPHKVPAVTQKLKKKGGNWTRTSPSWPNSTCSYRSRKHMKDMWPLPFLSNVPCVPAWVLRWYCYGLPQPRGTNVRANSTNKAVGEDCQCG